MKTVFWVLVIVLSMAAIIVAVELYNQQQLEICMKAFAQYTEAQCRVLIGDR